MTEQPTTPESSSSVLALVIMLRKPQPHYAVKDWLGRSQRMSFHAASVGRSFLAESATRPTTLRTTLVRHEQVFILGTFAWVHRNVLSFVWLNPNLSGQI
jgi:hypothetical protein